MDTKSNGTWPGPMLGAGIDLALIRKHLGGDCLVDFGGRGGPPCIIRQTDSGERRYYRDELVELCAAWRAESFAG